MTERRPSWPGRIWLAISAFWQILFNGEFARNLWRLHQGAEAPPPEPPAPEPAARLQEAGPAAALQLLGLLQQDGRFIDFIQEDIAGFSDAEIGAAARVVHEGCRKVMREHFTLEAVRGESEGTEERHLLPSFLYFPHPDELAPGELVLPWGAQPDFIVGALARERGAQTPIRLVSSAKSWLCHAGVDRRGAILPQEAPKEVLRAAVNEAGTLRLEAIPREGAERWQVELDVRS